MTEEQAKAAAGGKIKAFTKSKGKGKGAVAAAAVVEDFYNACELSDLCGVCGIDDDPYGINDALYYEEDCQYDEVYPDEGQDDFM